MHHRPFRRAIGCPVLLEITTIAVSVIQMSLKSVPKMLQFTSERMWSTQQLEENINATINDRHTLAQHIQTILTGSLDCKVSTKDGVCLQHLLLCDTLDVSQGFTSTITLPDTFLSSFCPVRIFSVSTQYFLSRYDFVYTFRILYLNN